MNASQLGTISEEAIAKAQAILNSPMGSENVKKDITTGSGAVAYNLQPVAMLLQPVITPVRNRTPRKKNTRGGTSSEWRVIQKLTGNYTNPFMSAEGAKASKINYTFDPKSAVFASIGIRDTVTWDAEDAAVGFETDLRARAVTNTLWATMIMEEQALLFGRRANLGSVTAPTVTASSTGGGIASGTYLVYVRAIVAPIGFGDGTNTIGRKSTSTSTGSLSGSTNKITAHTPWVEGAVQYEWYVDDGASGAVTLQTTTGINSVSLTALTTSGTVLGSDNVTNSQAIDGFIAQMTAAAGSNIRTLGTGTDGLGTDFTLDDIDAMNQTAWDTAKADPDIIFVNSTQCARMTNLWLAANGGPVSYVVPDKGALGNLTGGYRLTGYVNKITGKSQKIETHPYMPNGTMFAQTDMVPFPTGGDMVGVDIEFSRDYQQVDYALTAKQWEFEVFCREVLRVKFMGGTWVIRNASSKTTA